jgi:hypothetical protein
MTAAAEAGVATWGDGRAISHACSLLLSPGNWGGGSLPRTDRGPPKGKALASRLSLQQGPQPWGSRPVTPCGPGRFFWAREEGSSPSAELLYQTWCAVVRAGCSSHLGWSPGRRRDCQVGQGHRFLTSYHDVYSHHRTIETRIIYLVALCTLKITCDCLLFYSALSVCLILLERVGDRADRGVR